MTETFEDDQIRRKLGITSPKPLQSAVRHVMRTAEGKTGVIESLSRVGISGVAFKEYCSLLANGIQWVHEQYPDQEGPKFVFFGPKASRLTIEGAGVLEMQPTPSLARRSENEAYILIPYESVLEYQTDKENHAVYAFTAHTRSGLGEYTLDEMIFLTGVEEAYHAVQNQNPEIKKRLEMQEEKWNQGTAAVDLLFSGEDIIDTLNNDEAMDIHDIKPRERDVTPILEKALADYRRRKEEIRKI